MLLLALCLPLALADDLSSAWDRSLQLEESGDPRAAAAALLPFLSVYPQDYALALRVGWLSFRSGRYEDAERAYQMAVDLSSGAPDAVLGLAWTRLRLGDVASARQLLGQLPEDDLRAEELREALPRPWSAARLGGSFTALPPDAGPSAAFELRTGLSAGSRGISGGADLSVFAYDASAASASPIGGARLARGRHGNGNGGNGDNGTGDPRSPWSEPAEVPWVDLAGWGRLGVEGSRLGVEAVSAALVRTRGGSEQGFVLGGIVRAKIPSSPRVEGSLTRPRDGAPDVGRLAIAGLFDRGALGIEPQIALQYLSQDWLPSAGLTLWLLPERFGLWSGARVGPQRHASLLDLAVHAAWPATDRAGLWAGVRFGRLERSWLSLGWSAAWLDVDGAGPARAVPAHTVSLLFRPAS